jgi:hypothetical protein
MGPAAPLSVINTFPQVDNCRQVGHTSAMKIAVHLARHRRLVALAGLSLLLHLLALACIDALVSPAPPRIGTPLALRLVRAGAPARKAVAAQKAPTPAAAAAAALPEQPRLALPPMQPLLPAPDAAAGASAPAPASSAAPGSAPLQMPGRYRVRLPPSSRLRYAVTHSAPGQPAVAGEPAELNWERAHGAYRLRLDGVLGQLESEGGEDDAGIAPFLAREAGPAGGAQSTRFNREEGRIEHGPLAASDPLRLGSQDRASVLLQLAGIGLAEPDQVQDTVDLVVAGSGGTRVDRWQVVGNEDLATPAGVFATVRLARLAPAGEARVEIWLAQERNWLPVRLRVTHPDGTVANQLVTSIDTDTSATPGN